MFLTVKEIRKHFGEGDSRVEVLNGIDAEIEKGEICVLLGPSGSGKSVDYNIKCNTKKYGHHTHFRVKCNYHKTKDTEVEYEVLYTFYTI